jgi:hypothetical protein
MAFFAPGFRFFLRGRVSYQQQMEILGAPNENY